MKTVNVVVVGDLRHETPARETFTLRLANARNAVVLDAEGTGTIHDDDPVPGLSVADASAFEGDSGTVLMRFTVALSNPAADSVTVRYATAPGTAIGGQDYHGKSGTFTFRPGETSKAGAVRLVADHQREAPAVETFSVVLSSPAGADLVDGTGVMTIVDDDRRRATVP
jgi:chitinase